MDMNTRLHFTVEALNTVRPRISIDYREVCTI